MYTAADYLFDFPGQDWSEPQPTQVSQSAGRGHTVSDTHYTKRYQVEPPHRTAQSTSKPSGQRSAGVRTVPAERHNTDRNRTNSDVQAARRERPAPERRSAGGYHTAPEHHSGTYHTASEYHSAGGYRTTQEYRPTDPVQTAPGRRLAPSARQRRKRHRRARQSGLPRLVVVTLLFVLAAAWSLYGFTNSSSPLPDWITQDLLPKNPYSRPGDALTQVNGVVIHYVGDPGKTAKEQRDYFAGLEDSHAEKASCHFLIDQDGTILQCIPLDEIAFCNGERNGDTIAIECCHPDDSGSLTLETVSSLQKLVNWLSDTYHLQREDILRHYDISGKACPRWFVDHPEAWESFLDSLTFSNS